MRSIKRLEMFILTKDQVQYCVGIKQSNSDQNQVSGLLFNKSFFVKEKHYEVSEFDEAIKDYRENFLDNKEIKSPTLVIREEDSISIWKQDISYQAKAITKSSSSKKAKSLGNINLQRLAQQLQGNNGVEIKNRRHKLKLYQKCFLGNEAVDWLCRHLKISRVNAVLIGQKLIKAKLITHVSKGHDFEDKGFLYRFTNQEY